MAEWGCWKERHGCWLVQWQQGVPGFSRQWPRAPVSSSTDGWVNNGTSHTWWKVAELHQGQGCRAGRGRAGMRRRDNGRVTCRRVRRVKTRWTVNYTPHVQPRPHPSKPFPRPSLTPGSWLRVYMQWGEHWFTLSVVSQGEQYKPTNSI